MQLKRLVWDNVIRKKVCLHVLQTNNFMSYREQCTRKRNLELDCKRLWNGGWCNVNLLRGSRDVWTLHPVRVT